MSIDDGGPGSDVSDTHSELPTDPDAPSARPLHLQPMALLWVFAGGVLGTCLRVALEAALPHDSSQWPWVTFLINLIGASILGGLLEGLVNVGDDSGWLQRARLLGGTGGCGAFTTYSTLALEILLLGRDAHMATAVGYGLASIVGGVAMAWLGIVSAAELHRRRAES